MPGWTSRCATSPSRESAVWQCGFELFGAADVDLRRKTPALQLGEHFTLKTNLDKLQGEGSHRTVRLPYASASAKSDEENQRPDVADPGVGADECGASPGIEPSPRGLRVPNERQPTAEQHIEAHAHREGNSYATRRIPKPTVFRRSFGRRSQDAPNRLPIVCRAATHVEITPTVLRMSRSW